MSGGGLYDWPLRSDKGLKEKALNYLNVLRVR